MWVGSVPAAGATRSSLLTCAMRSVTACPTMLWKMSVPISGSACRTGEPSPGCRCGRGEPTPGTAAAGVGPVPPARMWRDLSQERLDARPCEKVRIDARPRCARTKTKQQSPSGTLRGDSKYDAWYVRGPSRRWRAAGASPVPVQVWAGVSPVRRRCGAWHEGRGEGNVEVGRESGGASERGKAGGGAAERERGRRGGWGGGGGGV